MMLDLSRENREGNSVSSNPKPTTTGVPAGLIATSFVDQYYKTLANSPQHIHRFYSQDSVFARLDEDDSLSIESDPVQNVTGQVAIHAKLRDLDYKQAKVVIDTIDYQDSLDGSVLVLVTGKLSNQGQPHRSFCQTVILARQEHGYYVRNDALRFLAEKPAQLIPDVVSEPAPTEVKPQSTPVQSPGAADQPEISKPSEAVVQDSSPAEPLPGTVEQPLPTEPEPMPVLPAEPSEQVPQNAVEQKVKPGAKANKPSWASLFTVPAPHANSATDNSASSTSPAAAVASTTPAPESQSVQSKPLPNFEKHIFVQNIPEGVKPADLRMLFLAYGHVTRVDCQPGRTFGFVVFENVDSVAAALQATVVLQGQELTVEQRKVRLNNNYRGRGRGHNNQTIGRPSRGRYVARQSRSTKGSPAGNDNPVPASEQA